MSSITNFPAKLVKWMQQHRRPAWMPKLAPAKPTSQGSKYADIPWLSKNESWPLCGSCNRPMQFIFQLDLNKLPAGARVTRSKGLLQLFYCTWSENCKPRIPTYKPFSESVLVRIVRENSPGKYVEDPDFEVKLDCFAIRRWAKFHEYARLQELEILGLDHAWENGCNHSITCYDLNLKIIGEDIYYRFDDRFPCYQGEKLGGWPLWIQQLEYPNCRQCKSPMDNCIYQIASDKSLHAGIGWILQCPKHLRELAFTYQR